MSDIRKYNDLISCFESLRNSDSAKMVKSQFEKAFLKKKAYIELKCQEGNPLHLGKLLDIYNDFVKDVFRSKPEHLFTYLLDELYPFEVEHVLKYMTSYEFSEGDSNVLLKGDIQSGKTLMMILTTLGYLMCDRDVVIITRNKLGDKKQFIKRFNQVVDRLREVKAYSNKNFTIGSIHNPPNHSCVFVEIYMRNNIQKLYECISQRELDTAVVYIDEADLRGSYRHSLFNEAGKIIYVSATVQDIVTSNWNIKTHSIVPLVSSEVYKGVDKLQFYICDLTVNDEFFYTLCDIAIDRDYEQVCPDHPKIVLINMYTKLSEQIELFDKFKHNNFCQYSLPVELENVCVMNYTGSGIKMYHATIKRHPKMNSIEEAFRYLYENGGKVTFPNIVIIAGCMADRGINFSCRFEDRKSGWHITHQMMYKSSTSSCATVLQACRILGNYEDEMPLKLYTTEEIKNKIEQSYKLSESIIHELVDSKEQESYTNQVCKKITLNRNEVPTKFLARKNVDKVFTLVDDDTGSDYDDKYEEDPKFIEYLFSKWCKTDLKISRFLRAIDPYKMYSISEFSTEFEYIRLSNFFGKGCKYGRGMLLVKTANSVYLNPSLRGLYIKYFS